MTEFRVIEAKMHHCGQLARRLRGEHRRGLETLGADPHKDLRGYFVLSVVRRAWLIDGEIAAIGGVTGPLMASEGSVWLAVSDLAARHGIAMFREARRQLEELCATRRALTALILPSDAASVRFAAHLGFHVAPPVPIDSREPLHAELWPGVRQVAARRPDARQAPFIIYTAGRSRTQWLAQFLTYGDWVCHSEVAIKLRSMADVREFLTRKATGTAETAGAAGWRLARHYAPHARIVVVRREVEEIVRSFARSSPVALRREDLAELTRIVAYEARCLDRIDCETEALTVSYHDLWKASACKRIFEYCLPYQFDFGWWKAMDQRNIQIDMRDRLAYALQWRDSIDAFKRSSKRELMALARAGAFAAAEGHA